MRQYLFLPTVIVAVLAVCCDGAAGHTFFMRALKTKYRFRSVSCYTCHAPVRGAPANRRVSVRNKFGSLLEQSWADKDVSGRIDAMEAADAAIEQAQADGNGFLAVIHERRKASIAHSVQKDFFEALEVVEAVEDEETGKTYGELLKSGELEGVRLPE